MIDLSANTILTADCLEILPQIPEASARLVIADPPYFRVLTGEAWDNQWADEAAYLEWSLCWMRLAMRALVPGGLLYCFGPGALWAEQARASLAATHGAGVRRV